MTKPTDLVQGTLDLLIMRTVATEPLHGWAIAQRIQLLSKDVLDRSLAVLKRKPDVVPHAVLEWKRAREHRRVGGKRLRRMRIGLFEQHALSDKAIDLGRARALVAVRRQSIRSEGIDRNQDDRPIGATSP